MKKILTTLILAALVIGMLWCAGCTDTDTATPEPALPSGTLVSGQTSLEQTADLIDTIDALSDNANIVISDLSLNMALGMALAGATDRCQDDLELYFGESKETVGQQHADLMAYYGQLESATVKLANSFWFANGFKLNKAYPALIKEKYQAESGQYDFTNPKTADTINNWCADKTNNLIRDVVTPDLIRDWSSALINALYFKAPWFSPFYKEATTEEQFTGFAKKVTVPMMHARDSIYLENEAATGFKKYYTEGIAFIGILPKAAGDFTIGSLDLDSLLASETYDYDVDIGLPRFTTEFSGNLADTYKALGLTEIFAGDASSFDGIGRAADGSPLCIGDIIHKTKMIVNEEGTEAAAVTVIGMKAMSAGPGFEKECKTVILDRPFAFLIYDTINDQILFAGKITDPTA